jgi:hypothetical protein
MQLQMPGMQEEGKAQISWFIGITGCPVEWYMKVRSMA